MKTMTTCMQPLLQFLYEIGNPKPQTLNPAEAATTSCPLGVLTESTLKQTKLKKAP